MTKQILIVDDELKRLASLRQGLAQLCPDWELSFMNRADEALNFLAVRPFEVVICDSHIQPMGGLEFLAEVGRLHPSIHRFLMADSQDKQSQMQCEHGALQFLPYQCPPETLKLAVNRATAMDRWVTNPQMKGLIKRIRTFPSIPSLYFEVLKELESTDVSVDRVAGIMAKDLAMCTKILRVLNSAFYAMPRQITDLKEAVNLLGFEMVKSHVLCIQVFSRFDQVKPNYFSIDKLWRHSMAVAHMARKVAQWEDMDEATAEEAYTAGLLHDIGKLVLANSFGEQCQQAQKLALEQNLPLWNVEKQMFGASHGEIGAFLVANWGLPVALAETAAFHHIPLATESPQAGALLAVHAANALVYEQNPDPDVPLAPAVDEEYLRRLGLEGHAQMWRDMLAGKPVDKTAFISNPPAPPPPPPAAPRMPAAKKWSLAATLAGCLLLTGWMFIKTPPEAVEPEAASEAPATTEATPSEEPAAAESAAAETKAAPEPPKVEAPKMLASIDAEPPLEELNVAPSPILPEPETVPAPTPAPPPEGKAATVRLQGIYFRQSNPTALINNHIMGVGDEIGGVTLLSVGPTTVIVQYDGKKKALSL